MAKLRICRGSVSLGGSNKVSVSYGGFTGTPSVVATVVGSDKNGANDQIRNRTASGCKFIAFYNGGLMLTKGTIDWIAIGPTNETRICGCGPHVCTVCEVYPG